MSDPTRTAILDAAEAAFKLEPFNRVSVAAIGTAAHASVGAIYHHFGDKEGLRAAVNERAMKRMVEGHLRAAFDPANGPMESVIAYARAYVKFSEDHPDDFQLLASAQHDPRASEHAQRFARGSSRFVASMLTDAIEIIKAGQATGEIRRGDPGGMVVLLWSALYGMCSLSQRYPGPVRGATGQSALGDLAVGLIEGALRPDPPAER